MSDIHACIYYGFDLADLADPVTDDDLTPDWGGAEIGDWEEVYAARLGYAQRPASDVRRLLDESPVKLDTYGLIGDSRWVVCVKGSVQTVDDYGSTALKPLRVGDRWDVELGEFIAILGLAVPAIAPGFHLNCSGF